MNAHLVDAGQFVAMLYAVLINHSRQANEYIVIAEERQRAVVDEIFLSVHNKTWR